jgi:hypothetical protein
VAASSCRAAAGCQTQSQIPSTRPRRDGCRLANAIPLEADEARLMNGTTLVGGQARPPLDCLRAAVAEAAPSAHSGPATGLAADWLRAGRPMAELSPERWQQHRPAAAYRTRRLATYPGQLTWTSALNSGSVLGKHLNLISWRPAIGNAAPVTPRRTGHKYEDNHNDSVTMAFALTRPARLRMHPLVVLTSLLAGFIYAFAYAPKARTRTKATIFPSRSTTSSGQGGNTSCCSSSTICYELCGGRPDAGE